MAWKVIRSDTFSRALKGYKKRRDLLEALDKKIQRLGKDPHAVGGYLSGRLHGYKGTKLATKFRLVFKISDSERIVYLMAIDHRKFEYERL